MSGEIHTKNMLLRLMSELYDRDRKWMDAALQRFGFQPGDVTFRFTQTGRVRATVHRWPWGGA